MNDYYISRGAAIGGDEGDMSPTLYNLGGPPMYCFPPPNFYHNIYFDWLFPYIQNRSSAPSTYT